MGVDISSDSNGTVYPNTGGISVARSIADLLPHLIPRRLRDHFEDATGKDNRFVWSMGEGDFSEGIAAENLFLRRKPESALKQVQGLVEPAGEMLLEAYQSALATTKEKWHVDEPTEET